SQANIIAEQSGWDDMDGAKSLDFTKAPFWVTADDGSSPTGIIDARDLASFMDEHEIEVSDARVLAGAQSRELQGRSASFIEGKNVSKTTSTSEVGSGIGAKARPVHRAKAGM